MCGIFGLVVQKKSAVTRDLPFRIFRMLARLSESRGREASGFAYTSGESVNVYKTPWPVSTLLMQKEFQHAREEIMQERDGFCFIGHSRLATNGTQYKDENNQPVASEGIVLVHNGIVVNADSLWKKHFPRRKPPELDTMSAVRVLSFYRKKISMRASMKKLFTLIEGEASVAVLSLGDSSLHLATNTGSLYGVHVGPGLFFFSSEDYITRTVLHSIKMKGTIMQVHPKTYYDVPVHRALPLQNIVHIPLSSPFVSARDLYRNSISALKKHEPDYLQIEKMKRCTKCILPETMPLIAFDTDGVCNYCNTYNKQRPLGKKQLEKYVSKFRSKNGKADCIVAFSGGRDSSYGLHYVKTALGMNPIAYTYDWGMVTDIARRNQSRMVSRLGVEHVWVSADIDYKRRNIKKNIEAWLAKPDIAMVPLFMAGDKQAEYYAEELKRKTGIRLLIYCRGNQLEDERFKFGYYGIFDGTPRGVIHNLSLWGKIIMAGYFAKACLRNTRYVNSSLIDTLFAYMSTYLMPHKDFVYLWHYVPWEERQIVTTLKREYNWETPADTITTWRIDDGTPPFYNYIYYHVQGFTEHDGLRSNQVREGVITRQQALELVQQENKPRYEALAWYFDVLGLDGDKVLSTIDAIRPLY